MEYAKTLVFKIRHRRIRHIGYRLLHCMRDAYILIHIGILLKLKILILKCTKGNVNRLHTFTRGFIIRLCIKIN